MNKIHLSLAGITVVLSSLVIFSFGCSSDAAEAAAEVESIQLDIPEEYKTGGFAVGVQAWTFREYTLFEAIEMTSRAGGRTLELFPGQNLSPDRPDVQFSHESPDELIEEVKQKLEEHGILPVNYGVVGLPNDEEESRKVFEFAQKLGVKAVSSEPSMEAMDLLEDLVTEYDIMLAIHNHPPRPNNPDYRVWDPEYVYSMVEGRDRRLGASADIGHWIRSDIRPIDGLQALEGRIVSLHMVDVDQFGREGGDVVHGKGVGDMAGVLAELRRQNFGGHISIEYETNWEHNITDVAQNIGFIRGWAAGQE